MKMDSVVDNDINQDGTRQQILKMASHIIKSAGKSLQMLRLLNFGESPKEGQMVLEELVASGNINLIRLDLEFNA